ncbi:HmuY family protein [Aureitalea marina]|uniref:Uncharacterized protein n=1 Tax=Aureitalea marina TaxID=930804 RepID=A0A2S7KRA9_9FLAO|nr:HmuY family protein [Aureitalea marina]PQB05165.1 hypothetical protein BST85_09910 [Aureitalea marina]
MQRPNLFFLLIFFSLIIGCSKDPELREVTVPEFTVTDIPSSKVRYDSAFDILGVGFPEVQVGIRVTISDVQANFTIVNDTLMSVLVNRVIPSGNSTVKVFRLNEEIYRSDIRVLMELFRDTIVNLRAIGSENVPDDGPFRRFDLIGGFSTGNTQEWDVAFRGATIAVNGGDEVGVIGEPVRNADVGGLVVELPYDQVLNADGLSFLQDAPGQWAIPDAPELGWYQLENNDQIIAPISGRTLVFRTRDGHFAKMEVLSYYLNSPENPDPEIDQDRTYTFRYTYNPNAGETFLK